MKTAQIYVHGSQDHCRDVGVSIGLTGKALLLFSRAAAEFTLTLEVDELTGKSTVIEIDGNPILRDGP